MWNAGVGTIEFDQINESEAQVTCESCKKKSLAREAVYKLKISTQEIPGSHDCLCGSPEKSALTRAKATLLMKATLERVSNEQEVKQFS